MKFGNLVLLTCLCVYTVCGIPLANAAVAPKSDKALMEDAKLALTGVVTSRKFKCINFLKGRVYYTVKINVSKVSKGNAEKQKELCFVAWQKRYGMPGPQGQGWLPKKGDKIKIYLTQNNKTWIPQIPNGIQKTE